jgi:plasmid stability protein
MCYCVNVKNITVTVPEDVYRKARIKAAELDTSVSALVRDFLNQLASEESDFERRKRLQDEVLATVESFRAHDCLSREEVHDRDALR